MDWDIKTVVRRIKWKIEDLFKAIGRLFTAQKGEFDEIHFTLALLGLDITHTREEIMATLEEVKAAVAAEAAEVAAKVTELAAEIQALKDALAAGTGVTAEDLDGLKASVEAIFAAPVVPPVEPPVVEPPVVEPPVVEPPSMGAAFGRRRN